MATTTLTTYLDASPPVFTPVVWASFLLLAFVLCTMAGIVLLQLGHLRRERRRRRLASQWLPLFNAVAAGRPVTVPRLTDVDRPMLLELWVDCRNLHHGEAGARLDRLAAQLDLEQAIRDILRPAPFALAARPVWQQNIALTAVRWLQSDTLLRYVYEAARSDNLHVAVSACFCLTRLKAPEYEQQVIALLFRFPAQSAYIATEMSQAGATEILQLMEPFIDEMPVDMATHFVALADKSRDPALLPLLIRRLARSREGREIAILVRNLGRLGDSNHRNLVARFLDDKRYYVRIQAIKALGRLGRSSDVKLLVPFLSDSEWWVRYRAARAIIRLLGRDAGAVDRLRASLEDRFARDILTHALTEMNWCLN